ncbi:glycoside hydrolase family 16 protein [Hypomontagnella monticulosa]|nr:glycoside hydrolase family 16 protein [Hypomontagnella monticulosa]
MVRRRGFRPLAVFSSLASLAGAAFPEVGDNRCDCYLTNGSSSHYFKSHKFFDYRDKSEYVKVPPLIDDADDSSQASATNDYILSNDWTDNWTLQSWNNTASLQSTESDASVFMVHSPNNVYFEKNQDPNPDSSTFLDMRTARMKDFQSSSEFESVIRNYHFLSVRMYARTIGAPGAVTAMFTFKDISNSTDLTAVQESDLEIRTLDPPDRVQYTNQPSYTSMGLDVQDATRNVTIPNKRDWTQWAVYRMDWSPDDTTWYINGDEVASISFQTPRDPSILIFNSWSDGGSWTGNMSVGTEAHLQIQWIEVVYNTTEPAASKTKRDEGQCFNVCSIDETSKIGTAVLMQGGASNLLGQLGGLTGVFSLASILSAILAF